LDVAAALHDVGKADPRFQAYLAGRGSCRTTGPLLAKSDRPRTVWQDRELKELLHLPRGFRHELLSMLMAERDPSIEGAHRDVILHLIATHHGWARPFPPVVLDAEPPGVQFDGLACSAHERLDRPPHRLDSGVVERFWTLTRRYGWWGLAYLESILRLADQHASAYDEQEART
jgi:CRISPR-associated endonuclease/helicase Cas3